MTARVALPVLVVGVAVTTGYIVAADPRAALGFALVAVGATALGAPAARWVAAALLATLLLRPLVDLGLLPSTATFVDMALAWGALAAALLRTRRIPQPAVWPLRLLGALAVVTLLSGLLNETEMLRPVAYFVLLGTPFAVVAALLVDRPSDPDRGMLRRVLLALLAVQIPLALWQTAAGGHGDNVQGTLIGAGAGAHVISAITLVGALWILLSLQRAPAVRLALAGPLLLIPLVADAKQVILAAPALVIAGNWRGWRDVLLRSSVVAVTLVALFTIVPAGGTAKGFIERSRDGQGGKEAAASTVLGALGGSPTSLAFGIGPAESVSRAAFMTTPLLLKQDSPLHVLRLGPAELAAKAQLDATAASGGGTSFNTGVSSALGVLGDLGILGAVVYASMLGYYFVALRRSQQREAVPATCGLALFALLGLVFDWWEQPPFGIVVGLLVGLALAKPRPQTTASTLGDHGDLRTGLRTHDPAEG